MRKILLLFGINLCLLSVFMLVLRQEPSEAYWIVYSTIDRNTNSYRIHRMLPDGAKSQPLTNSTTFSQFPRWSPNGEWIVFLTTLDGIPTLVRMQPDRSNQQQISIETALAQIVYVDWSPDSKWINYRTVDGHGWVSYLRHANGSDTTRISESSQEISQVSWSPDSKWMVFSAEGSLFRRNVDDPNIEMLTQSNIGARSPQYSPDGKWIAFIRNINEFDHLYRIRVDGSDMQALADMVYIESFNWSPDSEWITFGGDGNSSGVHIIRADGTDHRLVYANSEYSGAVWSPNGQWIYFHIYDSFNTFQFDIYRIRPDGTELQQITSTPNYYDDVIGNFSPVYDLPIHTNQLLAFSIGILLLSVLPIRRLWNKHS